MVIKTVALNALQLKNNHIISRGLLSKVLAGYLLTIVDFRRLSLRFFKAMI